MGVRKEGDYNIYIYLSLHYQFPANDSYIKMGRSEFNVPL